MVYEPANEADEMTNLPRGEGTVVIIGMRGAGKTHLGRAAARSLGFDFIDLDAVFESRHGPIKEFVNKNGWPIFRDAEVAELVTALKHHPTRTIIACGGGIVETPSGRAALRAHWPVVQIVRSISDIEIYLGADASRPSLGDPPRVIYDRRKGWCDGPRPPASSPAISRHLPPSPASSPVISCHLPRSPFISLYLPPHLPRSPTISPHLPRSPTISPDLPRSPVGTTSARTRT